MPKVVIDASSLVGAVLKSDSVPQRALSLARSKHILCLSPAVEAEYRAVLARPRFRPFVDAETIERLLDLLATAALTVEPSIRIADCRDAKDNKYLELALAAGADFIVSSDRDLLALDPWRGIRILNPAAFVAIDDKGA